MISNEFLHLPQAELQTEHRAHSSPLCWSAQEVKKKNKKIGGTGGEEGDKAMQNMKVKVA